MKSALTLEVLHDDSFDVDVRADSDHLGTIVAWHRYYRFDVDGSATYGSPKNFLATLKDKPHVILPVYLYDHSGLRIATSNSVFRAFDPQAWDHGQIGFIYCTEAGMWKWQGVRCLCEDWKQYAANILQAEIDELDDIYSGNVWYWRVLDASGETLDACSGYVGAKDACRKDGQAALDFLQIQENVQDAESTAAEIGMSLKEV